jgi:hypothetical protein
MKYHEREFFVSMIRSGKIFVEKNDILLEIKPLTIDQSFHACRIYQKSYERALSEEFMTEDDLSTWMIENNLWTPHEDKITDKMNKDIEKLKVEIYKSYGNEKLTKSIRFNLRALEFTLNSHLSKKHVYYTNTCEGIASRDKLEWTIKNTTYYKDNLYDFYDIDLEYIISEFQENILSEKKCREIARTEPWRSFWITRNNSNTKLFANSEDYELTYNQKNILVWSQMYDNIQESVDCPVDDIIQDDDMLDGWFIEQRDKREKEKLQKELENSSLKNEKIKNSQEVFVVADSEDKQRINLIEKMNDPQAKGIKNQRFNAIKQSDQSIDDHKLPDKQLEIMMQANNQRRKK